MTPDVFTERYRAIAARDARFDGQFVTAVRTTGIYCRPSCPARTPRRENVTFYLTSAAAHDAGYRACKRCLPEATPGTPAWDLRGDLTGRAMRLVADGVVDREGVEGLAGRLGYSPRHLHRVLRADLGAGPLTLARAHRAQTARTLLTSTDLPVADVAFAAGFGSIRQLNDTVREIFATTPTALRARRPAGTPAAHDPRRDDAAPVRLDLDLPVREPFDAVGTIAYLAARAVDGVESATIDGADATYARTLRLPHGPGAVQVRAGAAVGPGAVALHLELTSLQDVATAVARVRRLLDLDADPVAVDTALGADPVLAASVTATPGTRVPGTTDAHELVVRAIVGQQISVPAARTHLGRLATATGTPYVSRLPGLTRLFPTPEQVADDDGAHLALPARQRGTVTATARALADGALAVGVGADVATLRADLEARPGIGPWTSGYVALRVLGHPDTWLTGDVALRAGARTLGLPDTPRALAERAATWAPWRSYAARHVWRAALTGRTSA
ncbi:AlkA N-terminal domain-containing protein [Isoptericola halotolerans]|uniref:DNA-3-methyladenine glycosylase II n=1 Tax=Isoptericola halotolerans TaxID=300560 RepID=A0ABX1ZYX7_9MICO|nr:AlkA N-terminal domain-containing protein [Isoptericola halotolerans]NOV95812.1 AraC family transcriptional regulator of adaptative response / DNA-3-methyladenine glycosylase II [Isoptericola halotolerans]